MMRNPHHMVHASLGLALGLWLAAGAAQAQTAAGQVQTYQGPTLGAQWVLPSANTAGYGTGVAAWLATPSSANLATAVTGETGSGALVFGTSPTLATPTITTPTVTGGTLTASSLVTPNLTTPLIAQGAPTAKTVSATLTAAEIAAGIITVNQGAGGASAQQLPDAADMDTQFSTAAAGFAFDFSVINISTVAAEDATITTNTGWTLVGNIDIASNAAATDKSAGRFRARKTGTALWTLYRLS